MSPDVRGQAPALRAQTPALTPTLGSFPGAPGAAPGDPQIGHIFRNMRAAMRLSRESVARRLATAVTTIEDLESGAVTALPHWPETVRIVRAYCELLRLDPEPLLWRLQQLARQGVNEAMPAVARAPGGPPPLMLRNAASREQVGVERERRRGGGGLRRLLMLAALPALGAGLAYLTVVAPAAGYRLISLLPAAWSESARTSLDTIVVYSATRRDGLKWIDVGDPRLRKGDKLQTKAR